MNKTDDPINFQEPKMQETDKILPTSSEVVLSLRLDHKANSKSMAQIPDADVCYSVQENDCSSEHKNKETDVNACNKNNNYLDQPEGPTMDQFKHTTKTFVTKSLLIAVDQLVWE